MQSNNVVIQSIQHSQVSTDYAIFIGKQQQFYYLLSHTAVHFISVRYASLTSMRLNRQGRNMVARLRQVFFILMSDLLSSGTCLVLFIIE